MIEIQDQHIPVTVILNRLENHLEEMRRELACTPRWRFARRMTLTGICGAYQYEIDELLRITGSWQPVWTSRPANVHVESPTRIRRR